ncbi:hypothetical protein D9M69_613360 [compost metagenome]
MQVGHVESGRRQPLGNAGRAADGARDEATRLLRVVIFVRTEPALENMAVFALEVENFQCHDINMGCKSQNTRKHRPLAAFSLKRDGFPDAQHKAGLQARFAGAAAATFRVSG